MAGPGTATSLSVCCITRGPTRRVAAQLAPLRGIADEIVLAVDDRVDNTLLGPLAELAEALVLYPYLDPVDRPVGWVHSLCTRDWILWLDDDEVPGSELLRGLPELLRSPAETHYWLPRRWLYGSSDMYLAEAPWQPDYQLRLVQNDPRLLWFPGVTHRPIEAVGPHRYLEWPIYHADLLLNPLEGRRAKARRYETVAPGQRLAGVPMNLALHVPELRDTLDLRPLPPEDAEIVGGALAVEPWPEPAEPPAHRRATRNEVDAHWHGRGPTEDLYRAELELVDEPGTLALREVREVPVRVRNLGTHVWAWAELGASEIRASYRWWSAAGELVVADGLRTAFPRPVRPGEELVVPFCVEAPPGTGAWVLELDLVHEHVRWFGCGVRLSIDVRPLRRVGILGGDEDQLRAAAVAVADLLPGAEPVLLADDPTGASERVGYPAAPNARTQLLGDDAGRARVLARGAQLVATAAARRGSTGAAGALAGVDAVVDLGRDGSRREQLAHQALLLAARARGVPVVQEADGEHAARALARLLGEREA